MILRSIDYIEISVPTWLLAAVAVVKGNSVFTVTSAEAYAVASAAYGNKTPYEKDIHGDEIGYFWHYHVFKHRNDAHIYYLF